MSKLRTRLLTGIAAVGLSTVAVSAETIRWGGSTDLNSLDPYSYGSTFTLSFLNHVYEGLVRYDADLEIEPALAESWEIISDSVWRFHLREGVTFHNGADFTAEDVLASLTRVSHEDSPLRGNLPAYVSAEVVDDYTIDINLNGAYPLLLNDLTNIFIFDADWLRDNGAELPTDVAAGVEGYATFNANGTGPFVIEERVPDSRTEMVVNPGWWDTPVHNVSRIEFTPIQSAATRVAALLSGEIDFVEGAPIQDLPRLQAAPNVEVIEGSSLRTIMFGFNRQPNLADGRENPFNDSRLRWAIAHAIDVALIRDRVMRGSSRVAGTLIAPQIPGYTEELDEPIPFDLERAQELIAEVGAEGLAFELSCAFDLWVNEEEICSAVISMLTRAGLAPALDIAPRAVISPKMTNGQSDMFIFGWANEPMLDSFSILLQAVHSASGNGGVFNWGGWHYPEWDDLIQRAAVELDRDTRLGYQTEVLRQAREEMLFVPLHQQPMAWAVSDRVEYVLQQADNKPRHWLTRMAD
ncbi:MAG: ABC transporter substrate-binding protein [Porticoccaceae bacterium]